MRLNCGTPKRTRLINKAKKKMAWHKHFCWWPVRIADGDCRWLETVERKYTYWHWLWGNAGAIEYRENSTSI